MFLTEREQTLHSELFAQLKRDKDERHRQLREELLEISRPAARKRAWALFSWTVAAFLLLVTEKPSREFSLILAGGLLGYGAVAWKISEVRSDIEESNVRLRQLASLQEDLVYGATMLDELVTRLEQNIRTRKEG